MLVVGVDYGCSWNRSAENAGELWKQMTMTVIRSTARGQSRQSCVDESQETQ